jgi:trehalose 6-phosphate phosphatase
MQHGSARRSLHPFFENLRAAGRSVLALDYDGTLAPFRIDPMQAIPYPGVRELLQRIHTNGRTQLLLVTGRRAEEVRDLLGITPAPEIWGVHGRQRLWPDGRSEVVPLTPSDDHALTSAAAWVENCGYAVRTEKKPGSFAVHWRGLPSAEIARASHAAHAALALIAQHAGMSLLSFDGGVELRPREPNKGSVIRDLLNQHNNPAAFAFLGDDTTDEDAFLALQGTGALSVLVREAHRETAADVWIRPPEELLEFLERWANCCK